jgi:hypothetical protein
MNPSSKSMSLAMNVSHAVRRVENRPSGVSIYLFGSAVHSASPSDVDLLFLYDPGRISPRTAYKQFRPIIVAVEAACAIPVHPVVLTSDEERKTAFLSRVDSVPICD